MQLDHSENIIEISHISFSYAKELVLKDISFAIHRGDYLGIIGPNGGGKSTLLRLILGLLPIKEGEIKLFGQPINRFKDKSKLGYIPQKFHNFDSRFPITVEEVVAMGRYAKKGLFHWLTQEDRKIIDRSLEQVEMQEFAKRRIGDLSGGQQQRVFIARALAGEPEIIFLDEPTAGVDVKNQIDFYTLLRKLNQKLNLTLVLVSHDIGVVANEVTEIACINQTLVYHGATETFVKGNYLEKLYGRDIKYVAGPHIL